jgi:RNA polymerase sigma-70 factor, ECF subfamily
VNSSLAEELPFPAAPPDEDALVRAAQENPAAFGPLYERYGERIYWYLLTRTRNPEDAADLLQQVFVRALDALPQYRSRRGPFVGWLFAIARNMAVNFHRDRRSTVTWDLVPEVFRAADGNPEEQTFRREELSRLQLVFNQLDAAKRELIVLRFVAGLTAPQIAAVIGKSEAATKKQLSRTLQSLKENYHDDAR